MTEMVKRVARAISAKQLANCKMTFEECDPDYIAQQTAEAVAAIEAMRDPTDEMIAAASETDRATDQYCATGEEHWESMIDAALK